jgi:2-hydroxy-3-oxopropionate reductase
VIVGARPIVGLVGLGEIGASFARDLADGGFSVIGYDVDADKIRDPIEPAESCLAVAAGSEVVLIAVQGNDQLRQVINEVLPALGPRHGVVDNGTTLPGVDLECAALVRARDASFNDAPLTLRPDRTFLVGGELGLPVRTVLEALGEVVAVGPVGAGQRVKLVNQLLVFGNVAVHSEAVELARRAGVDVEVLRDALQWPISDRLLATEFAGADQMPLVCKDTGYILELAAECGARVPVAALLAEIFREVGHGPMHRAVTYWRADEEL